RYRSFMIHPGTIRRGRSLRGRRSFDTFEYVLEDRFHAGHRGGVVEGFLPGVEPCDGSLVEDYPFASGVSGEGGDFGFHVFSPSVSAALRVSLAAMTSGCPWTPRRLARSHAALSAGSDSAPVRSLIAAVSAPVSVGMGWTVNGARLPRVTVSATVRGSVMWDIARMRMPPISSLPNLIVGSP